MLRRPAQQPSARRRVSAEPRPAHPAGPTAARRALCLQLEQRPRHPADRDAQPRTRARLPRVRSPTTLMELQLRP
jgi:hypothetical protein